jgi:formylglycine-generating enzyme required for sulfatase activity
MTRYTLKTTLSLLVAFQALACLGATDVTAPAEAQANRGVLNRALLGPGHKTNSEGDRESLRLAIEDLISVHGSGYPGGKKFLARLEKIEDEKSSEFLALKKEALLANPLLEFDKVLMVRSPKGSRYAANWTTRSSCMPMNRPMTERELEGVLWNCRDAEIEGMVKTRNELRKTIGNQTQKLKKSSKYWRTELKTDPVAVKATAELEALLKKLHEAGLQKPAYKTAYEEMQNGKVFPNYEDELVVMSIKTGEMKTVYKPEPGKFVGDLDLHFNADRILFASHVNPGELKEVPNTQEGKGYAVFEMKIDPVSGMMTSEPRRVTPDMGWDVDNFDACYLPDDRIVFASTATYEGVPCVGGRDSVANLFIANMDGTNVRRLTFDQDASWHPCVMDDGRVMYSRWEYTDSSHYFSRILMTMNPDGTDQKSYYGSNSYWPSTMFWARQTPGSPTKFIAVISGHHGTGKGGALGLFDVSKGRHEADGAVQLITARGKEVNPIVLDQLASAYEPHFYTPYPLNDKYFLVMINNSIYLADVFDNLLCLAKGGKEGGYHDPVPLKKRKVPPLIPDRINLDSKQATVVISDIYSGPGLAGVPRGTVKALRIYRYEYGPRSKGGHSIMGVEAGWDAKQILGTAPVEEDGSCSFYVPANTPFAMQPLDENGNALQLMRSWTVAMPGEFLSCVGCHESRDMAPPNKPAAALLRAPSSLTPFYGPTRGFSFANEVQPVLKKHCISCHDGSRDLDANGRDKKGRYTVPNRILGTGEYAGKTFAEAGVPNFSNARSAYMSLHPYVRRNGPEGDYHLLTPLEFHADTSELFQMLEKGHHGVQLDRAAYDRLVAWADLNAPFIGTWTEAKVNPDILNRRIELRELYAFNDYNPEVVPEVEYVPGGGLMPLPPAPGEQVDPQPTQVQKMAEKIDKIDLGDGMVMEFSRMPAGRFSMGSNNETTVEQPVTHVEIDKPFYMQTTEVTLEQYRAFDPDYLNGVYDEHMKDQTDRGYYMNDMKFPVIRVSWENATEFCKWLSEKTGKKVSLPTEAQWEWACRAGTSSDLSYGDVNADFSKHANLADSMVWQMASRGGDRPLYENPPPHVDYELKDPRFNDGVLHLARVGSYLPNAWGLYDMHGNAAEWTRSDYKPYPYNDHDGRNAGSLTTDKTVRGGSWHDRPFRSTSSFRLGFPAWQRVYHVGFRVVIEQ